VTERQIAQCRFSTGLVALAPCAASPARQHGPLHRPVGRPRQDPICVIGTKRDLNTSYANAHITAHHLADAVRLSHQGQRHSSGTKTQPCVEHATRSYLVGLITPPKGNTCPSDQEPFDPQPGESVSGQPVR
jgi:hypothetical protein